MPSTRRIAKEANDRSKALEFKLEYPNGKLYKHTNDGCMYYYEYYDGYSHRKCALFFGNNPKQYAAYNTEFIIYLTINYENGGKGYFHIIKYSGEVVVYGFENPCPTGIEVQYHWSNIN